MKKILLCSAAVVGVAFAAAPAMAQVDVTVGGHTKNYVGFLDQDDSVSDVNSVDILRESELHFNAEGTADNGLTYGFHVETEVDGGSDNDSFDVEESYLYLASNLGRINLGNEDGANYLLQVAAPSADANIDGLRQYIQPIRFTADGGTDGPVDYANDLTAQSSKLTYLSPNWSGFQFGLSYTPDVTEDTDGNAGFSLDEAGLSEGYDAAIRYEGTFNNIGFALGAGYTHVENDTALAGFDEDIKEWNVGADFDIGAFGVGAAYTELNNAGGIDDADVDTFVIGADYTTGPFQFGASYLNRDIDSPIGGAEADRYTGGVIYTVTQGLTLRGSVSYYDEEDFEATSAMGGIQFNF